MLLRVSRAACVQSRFYFSGHTQVLQILCPTKICDCVIWTWLFTGQICYRVVCIVILRVALGVSGQRLCQVLSSNSFNHQPQGKDEIFRGIYSSISTTGVEFGCPEEQEVVSHVRFDRILRDTQSTRSQLSH